MRERLQKILAAHGVASRRKAEELIVAGAVQVNGITVQKLGAQADSTTDSITVHGHKLPSYEPIVYLLYKPRGVISSRLKQGKNDKLVTDLVPAQPPVHPVGRLDKESEGLLLLTNDGSLTEYLTHPKHHTVKEYRVELIPHPGKKLTPPEELAQRVQKGVWLSDGKIVADKAFVSQKNNRLFFTLSLHEGRHHAVRRLCATLGYRVKSLKRTQLGPLTLGKLKPGEYRRLTQHERAALTLNT